MFKVLRSNGVIKKKGQTFLLFNEPIGIEGEEERLDEWLKAERVNNSKLNFDCTKIVLGYISSVVEAATDIEECKECTIRLLEVLNAMA